MSGRSGVGQTRGAALGPQPLKATIPYQLASKPRSNRRDGKSAGRSKSHQLSSGMRRTMSLDAIIGPYLQGHWPKEPEGQSSLSRKDKSTQFRSSTPDSWSDNSQSRRGSSSHKRSASWGSAEHLREIAKLKQQLQQRNKPAASGGHDKDRQRGYPRGATQPVPIPLAPLSTLVPRLRCSVEGLNQELEGMFICQAPHPQHRSCSSGSQSDAATTPLSSSSTSPSPCSSPSHISTSPHNAEDTPLDPHKGVTDSADVCVLSPLPSQAEADLSLPLLISSSPVPTKAAASRGSLPRAAKSTPRQSKPALISSCPDPNKVNFTPHGGSAFCPVSLLKPLLPSMDLLFRSLAVSPGGSCLSQGSSPARQPPLATGQPPLPLLQSLPPTPPQPW
ncbi:hypothetical protein INR49_013665 [Caranx melampygus]|nr:hypothetical protein INR49_013665 [Caranx melampygus]